MQATRILVCVGAAAVGACAAEPGDGGLAGGDDDGAGGVIEAQLGGAGDPCPPDGCGGNSPVIDGVYFWRLHVGGKPNPEGVRITGVKKANGEKMKLEAVAAEGDRLRGMSLGSPVLVTEHAGLIGTRIAISLDGKPYEILINAVAPDERFWAVAGATTIESYELLYSPLSADERPRPLCSEDDDQPARLRALVFTGDLYNPRTKEITVGAETNGWLNIACERSAIYKMHKIGYTTAAQGRLGKATSVPQRRAMLNAWTSNVCGTGRSFTLPGEPLTLYESLGIQLATSPYVVNPTETHEAIWSETGAVCLDTHRREEDEPLIYQDIAQ